MLILAGCKNCVMSYVRMRWRTIWSFKFMEPFQGMVVVHTCTVQYVVRVDMNVAVAKPLFVCTVRLNEPILKFTKLIRNTHTHFDILEATSASE